MILAFSFPPYPSSLMNLDRELPENPQHPTSTVHIIVFQWLFLVSSTSCLYFVLFSSAAISMLSSNGTVSSIKIICFVDSEVNIRSGFNGRRRSEIPVWCLKETLPYYISWLIPLISYPISHSPTHQMDIWSINMAHVLSNMGRLVPFGRLLHVRAIQKLDFNNLGFYVGKKAQDAK